MRRAKIVCTLGPASSAPERLIELVAGRHGRRPAEHEPRRLLRPPANLRQRPRGRRESVGRPVGVLADLQGPEDPARPVRVRQGGAGRTAPAFTITVDDIQGTVDRCSTTYKGLPGDVQAGRRDPDRRRPAAAGGHRGDRHRRVTEVVVGGAVSNNKGINLPGVAVSVPAMSEKDTDDLRWALRNGRRHGRAVLRPQRRRHRARAPGDGRGRTPGPGHRQAREAAGGRQPRRDHRRLRRLHGGPRRPRRGASAGGGAAGPEEDRHGGPPLGQAGDRGHPDAGVDDLRARGRPGPRPPTSPTPSSTAPTR